MPFAPIDTRKCPAYADLMELRLEPDLAAKVEQWSARTGRPAGDLVQDALATYLAELSELGAMLEKRYNEIENGTVQPLTGEEAYRRLKESAARRRKSIA